MVDAVDKEGKEAIAHLTVGVLRLVDYARHFSLARRTHTNLPATGLHDISPLNSNFFMWSRNATVLCKWEFIDLRTIPWYLIKIESERLKRVA